MKLAWTHDHCNGETEWVKRDLGDWLTDVFELPSLILRPGITQEVRQHVKSEFEKEGWATNVKIDPDFDLSVFAIRDDLAMHLQTGNMSRAPYDLLKLQYLYSAKRIKAAGLALPTKAAAKTIGDNVAHADRVAKELELFRTIINVPIFLIAFE